MIWRAKHGAVVLVVLGARTWFIARDYAARRLGVSPDEIVVEPYQ